MSRSLKQNFRAFVSQILLYLLRKAYICAVNGLSSLDSYSSEVSNTHII